MFNRFLEGERKGLVEIWGESGTGKSVLGICALIRALARGEKVLVIDVHGQLAWDLTAALDAAGLQNWRESVELRYGGQTCASVLKALAAPPQNANTLMLVDAISASAQEAPWADLEPARMLSEVEWRLAQLAISPHVLRLIVLRTGKPSNDSGSVIQRVDSNVVPVLRMQLHSSTWASQHRIRCAQPSIIAEEEYAVVSSKEPRVQMAVYTFKGGGQLVEQKIAPSGASNAFS